MKYKNILEEELKTRVAEDYFAKFDNKTILGKIDFCVKDKQDTNHFLWAEAKRSIDDVYKTFTQLILTIGKARTFDNYLPPPFLGVFDYEKIAFIPYGSVVELFYQNDFNWNITSSNYDTKEFNQIYNLTKDILEKSNSKLEFYFDSDDAEIKEFIKTNFVLGKLDASKVKIDKNNFMVIYSKWLVAVKPTIAIDWSAVKQLNIIDADFYLADILSSKNETLKDKLSVLLKQNIYRLARGTDIGTGQPMFNEITFNDNQKAHNDFWQRYERPPIEEYWSYIIDRRDLLVPQDVRERKGSFFTPSIWVELSQKYLTDVLGDNWQDEYIIWDCAAGTGNLLVGLTNKYNLYASTLDNQDVKIMHDRIANGANLLEEHVFQFDFLNDSFDKLPDGLRKIVCDAEKRKKLLIYINPPYAEATTTRTVMGTGEHKSGVSTSHKASTTYKSKIGNASNEIYALFLARIYDEINGCKIGEFSKLKIIQSGNFDTFRKFFKVKFLKGFIIKANSFDNVKGKFPIGFKIWDTNEKEEIAQISCDIIDNDIKKMGEKKFFANNRKNINKWISQFDNKDHTGSFGFMANPGFDFQQNNYLYIEINKGISHVNYFCFKANNIIVGCVYFAVRKVIPATWLNDRDQFLYPADSWLSDNEFKSNCLAYTLFSNANNIQSKHGTNHFIPFTEKEVNAKSRFDSHFMTDFIAGKIETNSDTLFPSASTKQSISFSPSAVAVFTAGLELWTYYHSQPNVNVNASFYDIREYFQGRNEQGRMKAKSDDVKYNLLRDNLSLALTHLADQIEPKIYEHEFLK